MRIWKKIAVMAVACAVGAVIGWVVGCATWQAQA